MTSEGSLEDFFSNLIIEGFKLSEALDNPMNSADLNLAN